MEPFLGQIQAFGFNFAPRGWAKCEGQLLAISQNTALFSLLGTTYGGDGRTTFGLPDLRGRVIISPGQGPGLDNISWGQKSGAHSVSLNTTNLPAHSHSVQLNAAEEGNLDNPDGNYIAGNGMLSFSNAQNATMAASTTANTGGNIPVNIRNPYVGIYYCIALVGIYPSRN
ncbi:MAG: phage tail protein [Aequorivita sp.]|nr:phage tail protein [Aequorivita sp.]|tara:strand:- start:335 stop:847 length:513 start_codon:yes stop_codon:yes gene_type:complete